MNGCQKMVKWRAMVQSSFQSFNQHSTISKTVAGFTFSEARRRSWLQLLLIHLQPSGRFATSNDDGEWLLAMVQCLLRLVSWWFIMVNNDSSWELVWEWLMIRASWLMVDTLFHVGPASGSKKTWVFIKEAGGASGLMLGGFVLDASSTIVNDDGYAMICGWMPAVSHMLYESPSDEWSTRLDFLWRASKHQAAIIVPWKVYDLSFHVFGCRILQFAGSVVILVETALTWATLNSTVHYCLDRTIDIGYRTGLQW